MDIPDRATLTEREAEAWAAFYRLVDAVPVERREEPALDDGWSVKDVLWHVAFWWADMPVSFERFRTGAPDPEDRDTDATNAEALA